MRRLVVASAILATLLAMPLGTVATALTPSVSAADFQRATAALQYLLAAQGADGSIDASIGETADFVIGAAAAGYDPATLRGCSQGAGALAFIAAASDKATTDANKTGKAILAVVAAGDDPSNFDGRDLTARLAALYHSGTGAYGDGSTFSQSFAILAVVASGGSARAKATTELTALQGPDGSWSYGTSAPAAGEGDSNSTAIALMALDAAGITTSDAKALAYLATQQAADGGFVYSTAWGSTSDPDSDSMVLQALVAAGESPTSSAWSKGSANVLTALRASQGSDGGFVYPGSGESAFTTSQVPAALMRVPYSAPVHPTAGRSLPTTACPAPTPTPTATATPTPTPTPTTAPTPTPTATPTAAPTLAPTARPTVRPTRRPTAVPTISQTAQPTDTATPEPAPTATATETASPTPTEVSVVAAVTAGSGATPGAAGSVSIPPNSSGGIPAPVAYVLVALAGMAVVAGGGWWLFVRPGNR